ncbi:hypothetical protein PR202_gb28641 [Eleusine coracana subsp. coracana]|uniref:Uncharacterized protein n=1 Tax=Eleusine coracana subsp. coracana TaxID=191504 RepID=A0AAV5FXR1_ELECO|nr:hypothetical protein PR202_gb28641 [Eleusine coracana subsp. coracana]
MRKARAAAATTTSKPRARAKPKAKPSPVSLLSGVSSPSASAASHAADLSFLSPSSSPVAKPRTRNTPLAASPTFAAPASMSTVADLRSVAASHLDSLKRRLDALHGASVRDLEASHSRISKRVKVISRLRLLHLILPAYLLPSGDEFSMREPIVM